MEKGITSLNTSYNVKGWLHRSDLGVSNGNLINYNVFSKLDLESLLLKQNIKDTKWYIQLIHFQLILIISINNYIQFVSGY